MADERPITPEQALLAVKAAGLDPDKALSEQLHESTQVDEQTVKDWVTEAVTEAMAGQGSAGQPATPQPHEQLAEWLHAAQSKWMTLGDVSKGDPDGEAA